MKYLGKIWLSETTSLRELTKVLGIKNIKVYKTDDAIGIINWKGTDILVLLHVSWGKDKLAEKIRIFTHHLDLTEENNFWNLVIEKFQLARIINRTSRR